jgi:hypothetical protein
MRMSAEAQVAVRLFKQLNAKASDRLPLLLAGRTTLELDRVTNIWLKLANASASALHRNGENL